MSERTKICGKLTGRVRGRIGWFGRVVMQVEEYCISPEYCYPNSPKMTAYTDDDMWVTWRDATADDLTGKVFNA